MKIVEKYVFQSFLTAFALAWLVLSFVLTIGLLVRIAEAIVKGVSAQAIGQFMLVGFPETLWLTIPLSLLVGALLVFSRLSADSEIAAMRACGVNLLSVMKWPLLFAAGCTLLLFYVNNEIVPRAHEMKNNMKSMLSVDAGLKLLEPGRFIEVSDKATLYFAKREGNWVYDLLAYDSTSKEITREIRADKALISTNGTDIVLELYNVRIDPIATNKQGVAIMGRFTHTIPDAMKSRPYNRKEKDFRFFEMCAAITDLHENIRGLPDTFEEYAKSAHADPNLVQHGAEVYGRYRKSQVSKLSICRTLLQKRFAEAFAAICFVLIGVPLGIKAHRKDSTIGMGISLIVALVYYLFIIGANELQKSPEFYPHVLVWASVAVCAALAAVLIPKNL
jgi:lipopolysaccharide export system permease protein